MIRVKKEELEEILKTNKELDKYMNEYISTEYNTSKNTRESYKTDLYLLAKYYKGKNIKNLNKEDIQEYLRKNDKSSKTKARYLTSINNFYKYLVENNLISKNPCDGIKMPGSVCHRYAQPAVFLRNLSQLIGSDRTHAGDGNGSVCL